MSEEESIIESMNKSKSILLETLFKDSKISEETKELYRYNHQFIIIKASIFEEWYNRFISRVKPSNSCFYIKLVKLEDDNAETIK